MSPFSLFMPINLGFSSLSWDNKLLWDFVSIQPIEPLVLLRATHISLLRVISSTPLQPRSCWASSLSTLDQMEATEKKTKSDLRLNPILRLHVQEGTIECYIVPFSALRVSKWTIMILGYSIHYFKVWGNMIWFLYRNWFLY